MDEWMDGWMGLAFLAGSGYCLARFWCGGGGKGEIPNCMSEHLMQMKGR
jgi:hypothetical protein